MHWMEETGRPGKAMKSLLTGRSLCRINRDSALNRREHHHSLCITCLTV